jgi:hypothetical protein
LGKFVVQVRSVAVATRSRAGFDRTASGAPRTAARAAARSFHELDWVRHLLPADVLAAAEERAARLRVGADRVLIASGTLDEETYLRALGEQLGVAFEPLDGVARSLCLVGDDRLIESAANGMLPFAIDDDLFLAVAPRGAAARRIGAMIEENPGQARHFRFTSSERINRFALRCAGDVIAARAADGLKQTRPVLSAGPPRWHGNLVPLTIAGLAVLAGLVLATPAIMFLVELLLAGGFLAWLALRLVGALVDWVWRDRGADLPGQVCALLDILVWAAAFEDLRWRPTWVSYSWSSSFLTAES